MHIVCSGAVNPAEPTILLEAGGGGDYLSWDRIFPPMSATHRLCAYDRAGLGQSEPPTEAARTAADQVADLHALLDGAGVSGPFVIGAHSYGANVAILFTQAYPEEVVGVVLVDPQNPHFIAQVALPAPIPDEPAEVTAFRNDMATFDDDPSLNPEHLHLRPSLAAAAAALDAAGPFFGERPVVVLSAVRSPGVESGLPPGYAVAFDEVWFAGHQELADESTHGSVVPVLDVGHEIQAEDPRVVIDALEQILAELGAP